MVGRVGIIKVTQAGFESDVICSLFMTMMVISPVYANIKI